MNSRSGIVKGYTHDFLLDEPKLRKIVDVLKERSKKLPYKAYMEFYVEREDDAYYITRDLDEVLQDENTTGKSIRLLTIEIMKSDSDQVKKQKPPGENKPLVFIGFAPKAETKVRLSVTCEIRDWTFLTADEIDSQIKRTLHKRKIQWLKYSDFCLAALVVYLGIFLSSFFIPSLSITDAEITSMTTNEQIVKILETVGNRDNSLFYQLMLPWVATMFGFFFFAIYRPITHLVSKSRTSFFYWGDMTQIYNKFEQRNNIITTGIIIALVVSILGSI
ncbi:hypothetical protein ACFLWD_03695, partial [Chloroflexota bacterium]